MDRSAARPLLGFEFNQEPGVSGSAGAVLFVEYPADTAVTGTGAVWPVP